MHHVQHAGPSQTPRVRLAVHGLWWWAAPGLPGSHDFQPVTEQIEDALRGINWHEGALSELFGFRDSYYNFDGWGDLTARTICRRAAREVLGIADTQSIVLKPKAAPLRTQITQPLALGMKSEVPSHRQPDLEHL